MDARSSFRRSEPASVVMRAEPVPGLARRGRPFRYLSLVLFIAMHLACLLVFVYPPTRPLVALCVGGYLLRMWAITVGFHRYFAHRSFRTSRVFQLILAVLGTAAMQNDPIWWASFHRHHHKSADTSADPHSPHICSFWYAHVGWVFSPQHDDVDFSNVADLVRFSELRFLNRHKWMPLVGYALICYAIGGLAGVVWGFVVSTLAVDHATFLINSLGHVWGGRRYNTPDTSRNNPLLAALTLGEGWHNNHHFYMSAARQGFLWWELDPSYYTIKRNGAKAHIRHAGTPHAGREACRTSPRHTCPAVRRTRCCMRW